MLLGTVKEIGPKLKGRDLKVGDRIATLVSLSLTPLKVDEIISINKDTCQVKVKGQAILFETGIYAKIPSDMDEALALAILDVAGAPAQAAKLEQARPDRVHHRRRRQERPAVRLRGPQARQADRQGHLPGARRRRPQAPREVRLRRRHHPGLGHRPALRLGRGQQGDRRRDGRPDHQLRRHPQHRDGLDPRHQGRRPGLLLLDGDELHLGRPRAPRASAPTRP